jgi:carbonic anhydrase
VTNLQTLLDRNRAFAAQDHSGSAPRLPFQPRRSLYIVTCVDSRTDPAGFLGIEYGEALIARTVGGRVTPGVVRDVAYMAYLAETRSAEGPFFETAIIHHTDCGSNLLADPELRRAFGERSGYDEESLADMPVADPVQTVQIDVERLLAAPQISPFITVSGHVYDIETGLVTTIVEPAHPLGRSVT